MIERLEVQNVGLRRRLGQNRRNSDRPPPRKGWPSPPPRSLRRRSGRKPGGQLRHEGTTLRRVDKPDMVLVHEPTAWSLR